MRTPAQQENYDMLQRAFDPTYSPKTTSRTPSMATMKWLIGSGIVGLIVTAAVIVLTR